MRKEKSRSPPKLSNGRFLLILACLPTTCKNTDSQGCVSIDFTLYYLGDCWYFPNRQNKKSQLKNLSNMTLTYPFPLTCRMRMAMKYAGK